MSGVEPILFHCKISGDQLKDLATRIVKEGFEEKCVIGVLLPEDVEIIKGVSEKIKILSFMTSITLLDIFLETKAEYIRLWEPWENQDLIDKIHSKGKKVWIMAGNPRPDSVGYTTEENLLSWKRKGCDGVLVNDINWAKKTLQNG